MTTTRLMEATQGYEAAKQSGDTAAAKKNADIMNDILGDPKQVKKLQRHLILIFLEKGKIKTHQSIRDLLTRLKSLKVERVILIQQHRICTESTTSPQLSPQAQAQAAAVKAKVLPTADTQFVLE